MPEDLCPDDPDKTEPGDCGCGFSEFDSDEDGVKDCNDNAPYSPNADQADGDNDGSGDAGEKGPDNNNDQYDGNKDFTADLLQKNVASLFAQYANDYVTLSTGAECTLSNVVNIPEDEFDNLPAGINFPFGLFEFGVLDCLSNLGPGSAVTVTLHLPEGIKLPVDTYYKFGPTPDNPEYHWYEFLYDGETGVEFLEDSVVIYLVDGARGDDDLMVNGIILDLGGPASKDDGGSSGCFIKTLFAD